MKQKKMWILGFVSLWMVAELATAQNVAPVCADCGLMAATVRQAGATPAGIFENGRLNVAPIISRMGQANTVLNPWFTPVSQISVSIPVIGDQSIFNQQQPAAVKMFSDAPQFIFGQSRFERPGFIIPGAPN